MDDIFSGLFQKTFKKKGSSLILLTGDHGMKDTGGHGGSSYAEVHVPLVILGISCRNDSIEQVDVAANLAILLNLDIPSSSIGKLNRNFLNDLTLQQYLSALSYNSKVLGAKNTLCHDEFLLASNFHKTYLHTGDITMASKAIKLFEKCSAELNDVLIKSSVKQNFLSMIVSVIFVVYAFIISLTNFEILGKHIYPYFIYIILLLIRCFFDEYYVLFFGISVIFIQLIGTLKTLNISEYCNSDNTINTILFFQPFTWLSSSFIEEEQEYWYFSLNSFLVFQLIKSVKLQKPEFIKHWLLIAAFFRFSQTLNQTGDKWSAVPDSSDFLMKSENYFIYVVFVAISVISIYLTCFYDYHSYFTFFDILILIVIYAFKINMFNPIFLARTVYLLIATSLIINKHFINFWILLVCLVSKSHNLCLISMAIYTSRRIIEEYDTSTVTIVAHLILGKSLFFMQGNGNSLSNVDVSVGYIGLNSFQPILVGIQLLVNIYSLTILMHLLLINAYYFEKRRNILKVLYVDRLYSMLVCCLVSFIFRSHISVWTIYAPKLFIEFFHTVILFLEVVVYYLVLFLRGSRKSNLKSSEL
ncbi:hypothetical protein HHI36_001181 [Cryptolaemus montrouzieri]|uniref:GPI ethanolamine phosphate transferase 2 C-terminal domain-containing protein n=1 Tax=Cryptolaemus montrouzieri TaxID=559131 RepID=A0ABD2P6M6_9CUCU